MWTCYKSSFKKCLTTVLNESNPALVMKEAHKKYKEILSNVPEVKDVQMEFAVSDELIDMAKKLLNHET